MLNVTFSRHAKSNLSSYDGDDFTKDISEIGKQKTKKVGRFLKKKKLFLMKFYALLRFELKELWI